MRPSEWEFFTFTVLVTFSITAVIHSRARAFSLSPPLSSCPQFRYSGARVATHQLQRGAYRLQGQKGGSTNVTFPLGHREVQAPSPM